MVDFATRETRGTADDPPTGGRAPEAPALVVVWCRDEPHRVGEALFLPPSTEVVFGRDPPDPGDDDGRVRLERDRPGARTKAALLQNPFLSRAQLRLSAARDGVEVENLGKRDVSIGGRVQPSGFAPLGTTVAVDGQIVFLCVLRPASLPPSAAKIPLHPFGEADALGIVGESRAAWQLREQIAFVARRAPHVLILGESGTGKELVASALHQLSPRAPRRFLARNAATFPPGLIDAELFGNVAGYPNPGMPARAGVVGEADGGTLFLDEIGELPPELQAHLLRLLDAGGEYQRLGEARPRTADVRVIGATNRAIAELKHDLAARLQLRVKVPSLNDRLEDVPLLARHLLGRIVARDPEVGARFGVSQGAPPLSWRLARALVAHHRYTTHVRELEAFLWTALASSTGAEVDATDDVLEQIAPAAETRTSSAPPRRDATPEEIRAAMEKHGGVHEKVWRELGLPNRYVLHRLLKRLGSEPG